MLRSPNSLKRTHLTMYKYIAKEFIFAFLISFSFFFIIFFINQILLLAQQILEKRAPVFQVLLLLFFAMPTFVAMSFPFASLTGALMAIGRLSSDLEFLVFQASGISVKRMFVPFLVLGILFSSVSFIMNDYFLPLGLIQYTKLYQKLLISTPALELKSYSVKAYGQASIITGLVTDTLINNVTIIDITDERKSRIITAKSAQLLEQEDSLSLLSLKLKDVFTQISDPATPDRFEYSKAEEMTYNLLLKDISNVGSVIGPQHMSSVDVKKVIDEKQRNLNLRINDYREKLFVSEYSLSLMYSESAQNFNLDTDSALIQVERKLKNYTDLKRDIPQDRSLNNYLLEYYKKYSLPFSAFFFVLLAFPVGIKSRRSGKSVGFAIGLIVAVIYYSLLIVGQSFGTRLGFDAFLTMWFPDFFILALAIFFAIKRFVRINH